MARRPGAAPGVTSFGDSYAKLVRSAQLIKNEHRCLIFMTQPQVFSTDVSVFSRHTSQGKPLVMCDLFAHHTERKNS